MNLLVTGGLGFIGSNFVNQRYSMGDRVINLDVETYAANHKNIKLDGGTTGEYSWIKGDINDQQLVSDTLYKYDIDAVVHFAAESHVDRSIKDSKVFVNTNVNGTHNLLECARECKNDQLKFIHISTDEVYGDLTENEKPFTEKNRIQPNSPYAASKAASDLLVRSYNKTHGLHTCITRCSNNYGPNQHVEKLIPLMITKAIAGEPLPVYGDGRNIRDWVHVTDHCEAISRVLEDGTSGEVYNIGGRYEVRNIEIIKAILGTLNKSQDLITYVEDRKGHDWRYAMNINKIHRKLKWRPRVKFNDGLKSLIESYK
ncbi:dTDP-glucose 4,6-dehydratase [bacterium]|nr:dTDP-glucose 4,6-dehydratase [bacterium]